VGAADAQSGEGIDGLGPTLGGPGSVPGLLQSASTDGSASKTADTPLGSTLDRQRAIEIEEHAANVRQLRQALTLGAVLWVGWILIDWMVVTRIEPAPLSVYLVYRAAGWIVVVSAVVILSRAPPAGRVALLALDALAFAAATAAISLMCLKFRGFESPYSAGVLVVLACRGAFVARPWWDSIWPNVAIVLAFAGVLLGSTLFSESMAAQLSDAAAVWTFALVNAFLVTAAAFALLGGHTTWSLRRQVFEARNIGRYRMVRQLGKGGMGEIWAAHHPGLKRDVALKILRLGARDDGIALRRFEREVQATTELSHPNTVRVFDYGVTPDGLWYYAMELLEGLDLHGLVRRDGPLPAERARHLLLQASRALAEAHGRGIIHRDVKPHNLFITTAGGEPDFVKVLDFGIAKVTRTEADLTLTNAGWIGGTPAYMSPEAAAGQEVDARSDVYSLGATLYFALTGAPPFEGETIGALLSAHQRARPVPPSEKLGAPLPPALDALVMRCLAKSPDDRYASAAELADALADAC
jgi:eukaryotic-like serine/threonine-protein kinase